MLIQEIWLIKLVFAHLVTDFILQPASWVEDRKQKKFASPKLYWHGLITALLAWAVIGWQYWLVALVILISHVLIDGWKSYQPYTNGSFVIDQLLHFLVITGCWYFSFVGWEETRAGWQQFNQHLPAWKLITGFVFVTFPAGIIIGQFTRQWSQKLQESAAENTEGLINAGKWIGIAERIIVLIFVLHDQYAAIGLLVTSKSIIRFSEKNRQESKTEYLVIGTLLSIAIALVTGLWVK